MKKIFSWLWTIILLGLLVFCFFNREDVVKFVMGNATQFVNVEAKDANNYKTDFSFEFVKETDDFHVKNYQDILNVIYTVLNNGWNEFTFYCDNDYKSCTNDLAKISNDQVLLSVINNMVSPFNSYEKLYMTTNTYGKATISVDKLYSKEDIKLITEKINAIKKEVIKDDMSDREKISAYHDYVINNSSYDEDRARNIEKGNTETNAYNSHKANGPLLEGKSLCSGYSDAMKLYLDELNIPNYKIANDEHIWNLIYIDGQWLHLDLTWNDPVTSDGSNLLLHKFFLVTTTELSELDQTNHSFDANHYPEAG